MELIQSRVVHEDVSSLHGQMVKSRRHRKHGAGPYPGSGLAFASHFLTPEAAQRCQPVNYSSSSAE